MSSLQMLICRIRFFYWQFEKEECEVLKKFLLFVTWCYVIPKVLFAVLG